jgi:Flp pilus assembly protein TadG
MKEAGAVNDNLRTMRPRQRWRARTEDRTRAKAGASLVELALALPALLLIMLGTIDLGRLYFDYIELRAAVVDGASYASRNPTDLNGAINVASSTGVPAGTTFAVSTSGDCSTRGGGGKVTVTADSTFQPMMLQFFARFSIGPIALHSNSTMRCMT